MNDIEWPQPSKSKSLAAICLAHGIPVWKQHRALTDCTYIADLFDKMGDALPAMFDRAMRPKALFKAEVSKDDRQLAKDAGFWWNDEAVRWEKRIFVEDATALPFPTVEVAPWVPDTREQGLFAALVGFDNREKAKAAGFKWDIIVKGQWARRMAIEDVAGLPFQTRRVSE